MCGEVATVTLRYFLVPVPHFVRNKFSRGRRVNSVEVFERKSDDLGIWTWWWDPKGCSYARSFHSAQQGDRQRPNRELRTFHVPEWVELVWRGGSPPWRWGILGGCLGPGSHSLAVEGCEVEGPVTGSRPESFTARGPRQILTRSVVNMNHVRIVKLTKAQGLKLHSLLERGLVSSVSAREVRVEWLDLWFDQVLGR